jgi:pimeloyl-ACP methyl ester carboxylesterase
MEKKLARLGFEEKFFHTGDVILNYVAGPANGKPPMVFIPGQTVTWEEYTFLAPLLADRFDVYAVTLRGHGTSSWTPGAYSFNQLGEDMTAFLREVVGRPAVVVGNSSGGVLTAWLAANAPDLVRAIVLEDPPLFGCEWPAIKQTAVYDTWLAYSRMAVAGSGGFAWFFREHLVPMMQRSGDVMDSKAPPALVTKLVSRYIARRQAKAPGKPLDLKLLPPRRRIMLRGSSQFDGHFSRAFIDGSMGAGFDHAETLARITQPVLFLHAHYFVADDGRLMGAIDDNGVRRVESLVPGPWTYVRMDCGHVMALEAPEAEAEEIDRWFDGIGGER